MVNDELADNQAESNTLRIHLVVFILNTAKQLEKLGFVVLFDADTIVFYRDIQSLFFLVQRGCEGNLTLMGTKFDRVGDQVDDYLLQSFLVALHEERVAVGH